MAEKIAIATDGDTVSPHFGRCQEYTVIDVEDGKVVNKTTLKNPGHEPGVIPRFLNENGVHQIIAGGMGRRAQMLFEQFDIEWVLGVTGPVDRVIDQILDGTLCEGESLCSSSGEHHGDCDHH